MKLKELLEKKKIGKDTFANSIGVSTITIDNWLKGSMSPRLVHAMKIKQIFKNSITFNDLLSGKDQELYNEKN